MPTVPHSLGGAGVALLVLLLVCWILTTLSLSSLAGHEVHGDAALGQAYAWIFTIGLALLTWLWIGGLLLKAGTEDLLPSGLIALFFFLLIGASGAAAIGLLAADTHLVWPIVVPAAIPPIVGFYVFARYQPSLRSLFDTPAANFAVCGVLLVLCVLPWPSMLPRLMVRRPNPVLVEQAAKENRRSENLPKLQAMSADTQLLEYVDLLREENGVRPEALQVVRHLERRQKDIEDMLEWDVPVAIRLLPDLDLAATPRLCQAAGNYIRKTAKSSRVRPKQDPRPYSPEFLNELFPAIRWLIDNGCDCDDTVAAVQASVETFIESPDRNAAIAKLAALRKK